MLNHVTLMGRLTRDPEERYTANNTPVTSFTIAVDRDNDKKEVDFINCVAWRQTSNFVSTYFHKGDMIAVNGRLQVRSYIVERTGDKRETFDVVCDRVYFCGSKKNGNVSAIEEKAKRYPELIELDDESELPF